MLSNKKTFLITLPEQILHFTGAYFEGFLLVGKINKAFTDMRYFYATLSQLAESGFSVEVGGIDQVCQALSKETSVYCDFSILSVELYNQLRAIVNVKDGKLLINREIAVKSVKQLKSVKRACEISEKAFLATLPMIKEGVSELQIAARLEYEFKRRGANGLAFETIVAFGENSAVPHHQTSNKKLKKNSVILMDFGCKFNGYCSDMTRTLFYGEPDDKFLKAYEAVKNAHLIAREKIRPDMTAFEADKVARDYLTDLKIGEYFTHSLGHGIGTLIHEFPSISPRCDYKLKNGNVFSIEPGVYFNGEFGIRIEDSVYLKNNVVHSFMSDDLELKILK